KRTLNARSNRRGTSETIRGIQLEVHRLQRSPRMTGCGRPPSGRGPSDRDLTGKRTISNPGLAVYASFLGRGLDVLVQDPRPGRTDRGVTVAETGIELREYLW